MKAWLSQKLKKKKKANRRKTPDRSKLRLENLEERRLLTSTPFGANELDLGEFLLGSVAVTPVFLESDGSIDPSSENWSQDHINEVLANIDEGLDWWVDTLGTLTDIHELSFTVDTTFAQTPASSSYEAISRRSNDYVLYVDEFLASQGHANSGNLEVDIRSFNHAQREKHGTDWSFTMFVVPSQVDSDGQFRAGGSFRRAFAFAGGLFMVVPSTRPASTFAHETGHIFWGRDEYPGGGNYFQRRGYYNTQNLNAHDNPEPGFEQQPSIMASGGLLDTAYINNTSPESTLAMVGWQDSDNDGIFDVLDVPHRLSGTGYFNIHDGTYRFSGNATVQTLPNLNSSGLRNDITLNRIREIEYRFDDGPWQVHSSPDQPQVDLELSIVVPANAQEIEIRARDSKSTVISNVFRAPLVNANSTPVAGINGFVWIDANNNNNRDVGEDGQEFWQIDLVDNAGNVLELETNIEPDNYPDGQLVSGFSTEVTLRAIGTDADGRVGVFNDNLTSTGDKNFRGYSKSSRSYQANWTSETRRFQATFSQSQSTVSLDAIGSNSAGSFARMEAFNSSGQLIGRYTTGQLSFGQSETMTIERPQNDIAYVIAGGHARASVRLDNLRFGAEASTLTGTKGSFSFFGVPAGDYNVRATPNGSFVASEPVGGQQVATVTTNTATVGVDFGFVATTSRWQNPTNANDVNADSFVTPLDALLIINEINNNGSRNLNDDPPPTPPYIDASGDGFLSALDVLLVVNFLNNNADGEGENAPERQFAANDQFFGELGL